MLSQQDRGKLTEWCHERAGSVEEGPHGFECDAGDVQIDYDGEYLFVSTDGPGTDVAASGRLDHLEARGFDLDFVLESGERVSVGDDVGKYGNEYR